jgi:serine/threonine protein kinase
LQVLLFGDEGSGPYRSAAEHVESCETCRRRLTELAGEPRWWNEAQELLSDAETESRSDDAELPLPAAEDVRLPGETAAGSPQDLAFLAPPSHPELLGRLGRYEIERIIGRGGMGVVLKGFDTDLNRPVAVKVLAPHLAHNGAARQRFAREGRAAAAVVHEHVVAIHNVESDGEVPFLVMQYVSGESLQARVAREGPLGISEILRIAIQAASGLAAAHEQGLVHRDIKPGNLLLETGVERALLTDFGLARAIDDASLTHTGIVAGTPDYMSPEQADGRAVDHRSDLFSLGAVLYFMATGRPPFRADRPMAVLNRICHSRQRPVREINPRVPPVLAAMIDRLLEKKPSRRPGSAAEVQQALARMLSDVQLGRTIRRPARRLLLTAGLAAAGASVCGLLAGTLIWAFLWRSDATISTPPLPSRPPTHVPTSDPGADDLVPRLLSVGPSIESDYASEAAGVRDDVQRLESPMSLGQAFLQQALPDDDGDLDILGRELSQLERLP